MKKRTEVNGSLQKKDRALSVQLFLPPDLVWFSGHFPKQPLLPGVVQLEWALHYAGILLNRKTALHAVPQLKFTVPVFPGETLTLEIETDDAAASPALIRFSYSTVRNGEAVRVSQGKIRA